jgi:hypothetical protein
MKNILPKILLGLFISAILYCLVLMVMDVKFAFWPPPPEKTVRIVQRSDGFYEVECRYLRTWMEHSSTASTNLDEVKKHRDWFIQHRRNEIAEKKLTRKVIQ